MSNIPLKWLIVGLFVCLFILTFLPRCSRAAEFEAQVGSKIVRGETWSAAALIYWPRVVADKADIRCRILLYGPSTFHGEQAQNAQVGCQLLSGWRRIDLGLGVQEMMRGDAYNAGGMVFWLTARYRFTDHFALEYSHSSNAGTKDPNYGSDFVFAAWKF